MVLKMRYNIVSIIYTKTLNLIAIMLILTLTITITQAKILRNRQIRVWM